MSHKSWLIAFSSFSLILILSSCGGNDSKKSVESKTASGNDSIKYIKLEDSKEFLPSWSKENVLVYHTIGEPDDMHPTNGTSAARSEIFLYTQMTLIQTDFRTLGLKPLLAKALPELSADNLNYTYELKDNVKWDDGSPMTVEDVIFTFKANKCPLTNNPHAKPYLDNLKEIIVDAQNPYKITLQMKRQYVQNITFLADYPIMQRKFFDPKNTLSKYTFAQFDDPNFKADTKADLNAWGTEFNDPKYSRDPQYLPGLGQYKLSKWDAGQTITLVKKENHWTNGSTDPYETSYSDKIIFKINKDANSQLLEFKSQAMDASTYLSTKTLMELQKDDNFNKNYNSRFTDTYNYQYIAMNAKPDGITQKKFFDDVKVRKAMAYLVPVDDINKVVNKGRNKRMVGPVSPLKPEYNSDLQLIPFDLEKAKQLLDEAGWKDTDGDNIRDKMIDGQKVQMSFSLNFMTTQIEWKDMAQMVSEAMYKAGVKANINPLDFAVLYDNAKNHKFDMMIAAWAGNAAPEDFTQIWHSSSWATKGSNYAGFGNSESDAIIDSIKYSVDDNKRIALVKKLQAMIYEQQPYVFLCANLRRNVIHKRFGNAEMYFERPGVQLNNLKLLPGGASKPMATN
jgi:peptide/nickel transport system substrate-binding protein